MQARAAVMPERFGRWTIETLEVAEPGPQEVLVRVVASGICQTDVHARDGFFPIPCPAVYGHEGAGIVEQVGSAVTTLKPGAASAKTCGDRVSILAPSARMRAAAARQAASLSLPQTHIMPTWVTNEPSPAISGKDSRIWSPRIASWDTSGIR